MTAADLYALAATLLVVAVLATGLARLLRVPPLAARLVGLALAAGFAVAPGLVRAAETLVSLLAPFAPGLIVGAVVILVRPLGRLPAPAPLSRPEIIAGGALAAAWYAASLGAVALDPYAAFYDPAGAVALTGAIVAAGAALRRPLLALVGPLALAVWLSGIGGSENAADAVLHPLMLAGLVPGVLCPRRPEPSRPGTGVAREPPEAR